MPCWTKKTITSNIYFFVLVLYNFPQTWLELPSFSISPPHFLVHRHHSAKVRDWIRELRQHGPENIVISIAGNKCDLDDLREIPVKIAAEYAEEVGAVFTETSAKTSANIKELFIAISKCRNYFHLIRMRCNEAMFNKLDYLKFISYPLCPHCDFFFPLPGKLWSFMATEHLTALLSISNAFLYRVAQKECNNFDS